MVPVQAFDVFNLVSYLDLLMRTRDRTTGRGFTDVELAAQVTPAPACTHSYRLILSGSGGSHGCVIEIMQQPVAPMHSA